MKRNRIVGLLLVAVSAITLGYCNSGGVDAFAMFAIFMAFIGAFSNIKVQLKPFRKVIALLVIALIFALYFRSTHSGGGWSSSASIREQWLLISRYFITISVFYFFARKEEGLPPVVIIFLAISVLIAPNIISRNVMDMRAITFTMLFVIAAAFFCYSNLRFSTYQFSGMRVKLSVIVLIFGSSVFIGYYGGAALIKYRDDIANFVMRYHPAPHLFSGSSGSRERDTITFEQMSKLDSIMLARAAQSRKVIFRVFSEPNPGYLRCRPYEVWTGRSWQAIEDESKIINPSEYHPVWPYESRETDNDFLLEYDQIVPNGRVSSNSYDYYDVWPIFSYQGRVCVPTGTSYIEIPSEKMLISPSAMIDYAGDHLPGANYHAAVPKVKVRRVLDSVKLEPYLQEPEGGIDSSIVNLAERVTAGCDNSSEKISKVKQYFQTNYHYSLSPKFPDSVDQIKYFLLYHVDSYCEYFATGTVLLLRSVGVPCRYVVGYYVTERDTVTDCWVARQRDAHAWAEAWDDELGEWVVVESTPASGMPSVNDEVALLSNYLNYLKFKFQEIRVILGLKGIAGLRLWLSDTLYFSLQWLFTTVPGYLILVFITLLMSKRFKQKVIMLWQVRKVPVRIRRLNRKLAAMDRRVGRYGLRRMPDETIRIFAERIEDAENIRNKVKQGNYVSWYLEYEKERYSSGE